MSIYHILCLYTVYHIFSVICNTLMYVLMIVILLLKYLVDN